MVNDPPLDSEGKYRPRKPKDWDKFYPPGTPGPEWANFKYND